MRSNNKQVVVGVAISITSYAEATGAIRDWIAAGKLSESGPARYICVTSVHGIVTAYQDKEFQRILNNADLATPDGMPIVWAMRSFGIRSQERVYGPTLMLALCKQATQCNHKVFLYGASNDTLTSLHAALRKKMPGLDIVGMLSPPYRPLTPEEDADCVRRISASGADIVFVGLSTPKQERWMYGHRHAFPGKVMVGVGAAFDFHAGRVKQAPLLVQTLGLEWLFRLLMEPRRLWRRYLLITPRFLPLWAMQKLGWIRYPAPDQSLDFLTTIEPK